MKVISSNESNIVVSSSKNQRQEFLINSSAEFFNILSSNLYKNPLNAMVRETICNAWDANIETGKEDIPIKITVSNNSFIVKDSGNGIDPAKMQEIYCTYGFSTKTSDSKQTGGFGLGCKSPFAYTDAFTVTSNYQGNKNVFLLSKNSVQGDGKPTLQPIAHVPTKDIGLEVNIPIKNEEDSSDILLYLEDLIVHGGINAEVNGQVLKTFHFDNPINFMKNPPVTSFDVIYGSVTYGINTEEIPLLKKFFKDLNTSFVFRAKEGEVDITPSREDLQYSAKTIAFIEDKIKKIKYALNQVNTISVLKLFNNITAFYRTKELDLIKDNVIYSEEDLKNLALTYYFNEIKHSIKYGYNMKLKLQILDYYLNGKDDLGNLIKQALMYRYTKDYVNVFEYIKNRYKSSGLHIAISTRSNTLINIMSAGQIDNIDFLFKKIAIIGKTYKVVDYFYEKYSSDEGCLYFTGSRNRTNEVIPKLEADGYQIIDLRDIEEKNTPKRESTSYAKYSTISGDRYVDHSDIEYALCTKSKFWEDITWACAHLIKEAFPNILSVPNKQKFARYIEKGTFKDAIPLISSWVDDQILRRHLFNKVKYILDKELEHSPYLVNINFMKYLRKSPYKPLKSSFSGNDLDVYNLTKHLVSCGLGSELQKKLLTIKPKKTLIKAHRKFFAKSVRQTLSAKDLYTYYLYDTKVNLNDAISK